VKYVDTVAFIVEKEGRILVERRKLTKENDPGTVAIPGGHVEGGESFEEACRRELHEELGLTCEGFSFIVKLPHRTGSEDQMVHYFSCDSWTGDPECHEAEEIFWIDRGQLDALDFEIDRTAASMFLSDAA
jgi:mutator protein MutT